ncbi:MAG: AIPR family protein, partial [Halieaceae bacterium]|nr:AIPR family protein [Halieaceae bacterium]
QRKKFDLENPRSQLFTKTDLAKFINVWELKPDKVSQGAQKNFADFAQSIGPAWKKNENDFNESFFKEIVAKAIIFRSTEKIVSAQTWYEGGYRANIVAYAIAKLAHDVAHKKHAVDFRKIWGEQSVPMGMEQALAHVAKAAHDVLTNTPTGIRNVTEWAKKQACWHRVMKLDIEWPDELVEGLVSSEEHKGRKREDRKDQRLLNGIEAQTAVFNAGGPFWKQTLDWGKNRTLLSEKETGLLTTASRIPAKLPTERQAQAIIEIFSKLKQEGLQTELP